NRDGTPTTPAPVSVQTMTAGYTHDVEKCVAEINRMAAAGADIVRVAVPEKKDTEALKEILPRVRVPIVADVHFHFQRALEAIEAGVNEGSIIERKDKQKRLKELGQVFSDNKKGYLLAIIITKLEEYLDVFYEE